VGCSVDQAAAESGDCGAGPIRDVERFQDVRDVALDRGFGEMQALGDLVVGEAEGHQLQYIALVLRQDWVDLVSRASLLAEGFPAINLRGA
jgi:hypothetical protein